MVTLDEGGFGGEFRSIFRPPPALERFVEHSWIQEHPRDIDGSSRSLRIIPDASPHLLLHVFRPSPEGPTRRPRLALVGPRTVYVDSPLVARRHTVGIRLRPGTLPLLTGLPASDLTDRSARLDEVAGCADPELRERIVDGLDPEASRLGMLAWLTETLTHSRDIDWRIRCAWQHVRSSGGVGSVRGLSEVTGISRRTLQNVVRAEVGLGPKRMSRIVRLQEALTRALSEPGRAWSTIATASGYCDQAHLIHDVQELLGESPERFRARGLVEGVADSYKRPDRDAATL